MRETPSKRLSLIAALAAVLAAGGGPGPARGHEPGYTTDFRLEHCSWAAKDTPASGNPYFPLAPGHRVRLEGDDQAVEITVLNATRRITFQSPGGGRVALRARVVEEREWEEDELTEVSRNWFARCRETGDVFYFGEAVDNYEDGEIADHEGSWVAGAAGAQPGLIMPGRILLGARYFQEQVPGVALDRGEIVAMGLEVETPAGTFTDCVGIADTDALEPDAAADPKAFCRGIGQVLDEDLLLTEVSRVRKGQQ